ncbi:RING finger protein 150a isoform X1 [Pleuronectes platessa]|uniref:RING finger protein 150a isoform X1 n=1 Tax=Pleuronectes platessa TaxID=8262 RepID=UPI00232A4FC4|nr:RING finger protein 150a isoform X1 [Pleuronectes platessa]
MAPSLIRACRSLALSTWLLSFCFVHLLCLDFTVAEKEEWYTAFVNITYLDPVTAEVRTEKTECGRYGEHSPKKEARGLVLLPSPLQDRQACDPHVRFPPVAHNAAWVALVAAGNCTYRDKIRNVANLNASAVVIYNVGSSSPNETITMPHPGVLCPTGLRGQMSPIGWTPLAEMNAFIPPAAAPQLLCAIIPTITGFLGTGDVVAIMIPEPKGRELINLLERGTKVRMQISIGTRNLQKYVSRTSVVFVSISFIVLMIISLAWLVFYYIQRFRYANARDRNQRRLGDAAKKAISKLQVRTIRKGDEETESDFDNCAVCIEGYKPNDVVRVLPCRHVFHKHCVDPWLLDHRTCPMCKMNILKALGVTLNPDCLDEIPADYEMSVGGPSNNPISGASEITVNESSVVLDPGDRGMGLQHLQHDAETALQAGESHLMASSEHQPPLSCDSDTSVIMGLEVGLSEIELSAERECDEGKS